MQLLLVKGTALILTHDMHTRVGANLISTVLTSRKNDRTVLCKGCKIYKNKVEHVQNDFLECLLVVTSAYCTPERVCTKDTIVCTKT